MNCDRVLQGNFAKILLRVGQIQTLPRENITNTGFGSEIQLSSS